MKGENGEESVYPDNRWSTESHLKILNEIVMSRPSLVHPDRDQTRDIIHEARKQINIDKKEELKKWDYLVSRAGCVSVNYERLRDPLVVFRHRINRSLLTIMHAIIEDSDELAR